MTSPVHVIGGVWWSRGC